MIDGLRQYIKRITRHELIKLCPPKTAEEVEKECDELLDSIKIEHDNMAQRMREGREIKREG